MQAVLDTRLAQADAKLRFELPLIEDGTAPLGRRFLQH